MWLDTRNAIIHLVGGAILLGLSVLFCYHSYILWKSEIWLDKVVYSVFPMTAIIGLSQVCYAVLSLICYRNIPVPIEANDSVSNYAIPYMVRESYNSYSYNHRAKEFQVNDRPVDVEFYDPSMV